MKPRETGAERSSHACGSDHRSSEADSNLPIETKEHGSVPGLQAWLTARLAQEAVPASEVMAAALYHPRDGYYRRAQGAWGFEGADYYTALDCGPLLGETLALRLEGVWKALGCPASFTVLEPGAGRGWLGRDLLQAACGAFQSALRYLHQDDHPAARAEATVALAPWLADGRARLVSEDEVLEPFEGAIVSNELFDALPAQPWRWNGLAWERAVLTAEGPAWDVSDPGSAGVWWASQAEDGLKPGDGSVWCETLDAVLERLTVPLRRGIFVAIDYGETAARLLAKGAGLRRYRSHRVDGAWWHELGSSDLTADVDFTRLEQGLRELGFQPEPLRTLSHWVRTHGPLAAWGAAWSTMPPDRRRARMENLLALTLPGMMGDRFKVLEAHRG